LKNKKNSNILAFFALVNSLIIELQRKVKTRVLKTISHIFILNRVYSKNMALEGKVSLSLKFLQLSKALKKILRKGTKA